MSRDSLGVDWARSAEVKAIVARKRNGIRRVSFVDMIGLNGEVGETNSIYHANEQEEKDNAEAQSSQRIRRDRKNAGEVFNVGKKGAACCAPTRGAMHVRAMGGDRRRRRVGRCGERRLGR